MTDVTINVTVTEGGTIDADLSAATTVSTTVETGAQIISEVTGGAKGDKGATGATGPTGATGATGATGSQGSAGACGVSGVSGVSGVKGDTGACGVSGVSGVSGVTGVPGACGVSGTAGTNGTNGACGVSGTTGACGVSGVNGIPGPTGVTGATGPAGSDGQSFTWRGTWDILTVYALDDVVRGSDGTDYISVQNANVGNDPTLDTMHTFWDIMVIQGPVGPTGPQGACGVSGVAGACGVSGVAGVAGACGVSGVAGACGVSGTTGACGVSGVSGVAGAAGGAAAWLGPWVTATPYAVDDIVSNGGSSWICIVAHTSGASTEPGVGGSYTDDWLLVAQKGACGVSGTTGSVGACGVSGTTGACGVSGVAGTAGACGVSGVAGACGVSGVAGTNGACGVSGVAGACGVSGVAGACGVSGTTGACGVSGVSGVTGVPGTNGACGVSGVIGATGPALTGSILAYGGRTAPTGYLNCDGSAVSRSTYAALFAVVAPSQAITSISNATPAVVTTTGNHGLSTGDAVYLTTSSGLPTGLSVNTLYYVVRTAATTFNLSTTRANAYAGTKINTSSAGSGSHTLWDCPYGLGDGSTTFTLPDLRGRTPAGMDTTAGTAASRLTLAQTQGVYGNIGATGGEQGHQLTTAELAAHTHSIQTYAGAGGGGEIFTSNNVTPNTRNTASTGGDTAHNTVAPTQLVNYIIAI